MCVSYLEQTRVKQQRVCRLGVVFALQVKIPQLVKVPEHTHIHIQVHTQAQAHIRRGQVKFNITPLGATVWQLEDPQMT